MDFSDPTKDKKVIKYCFFGGLCLRIFRLIHDQFSGKSRRKLKYLFVC